MQFTLNTHMHLETRLRMSGDISPIPHTCAWRSAKLSTRHNFIVPSNQYDKLIMVPMIWGRHLKLPKTNSSEGQAYG
jgi:hypothetical protein